ncbi:transcriptional regulator [Pseudomonas sp. NPDC089407]|uniref:helix-turn-helix transcriptional regulator n=1 Tax=Pseudomonas sp. NPDC089407 TaxID=3364464 RepID=UPI00385064EA
MPTPANYEAIADAIATLFFPHAEIILHELKTQQVTYIANNFSQRELGDDSALDELPGAFESATTIGPYEKLNWNGQNTRSISVVLRDSADKPAYIMCINLNLSVFEQARDALNNLFKASRIIPQPEALFRDDWQEKINTFLQGWMRDRNLSFATLKMRDKRQLINALYNERAFDGKSAADYISKVLGLGRATVYKWLKQLKSNTSPDARPEIQ